MSLEDLTQHAALQQEKINQLLGANKPASRLCFARVKPSTSPWAALRRSLWGKGLGFLEDQTIISHSPPAATRPILEFPRVMRNVWPSASSRILVRSEYEEAEQAVLSANASGMEAFLVAGHPGIGSLPSRPVIFNAPHFLIRKNRLFRLAPNAPPRSWAPHSNAFSGWPRASLPRKGHLSVPTFERRRSLFQVNIPPSQFWQNLGSRGRRPVLVQARTDIHQSRSILHRRNGFAQSVKTQVGQSRHRCRLFLHEDLGLLGSSPNVRAYVTQRSGYSRFPSRPYLGLSHGGPFEEHELRHMYDTYGASPRILAKFSRNPAAYEDLIMNKLWVTTPERFCDAMLSPHSGNSYFFALMEPDPENRRLPVNKIASRTMFGNVWHRPLRQSVPHMRQIYRYFTDNPFGAPAADWMFEFRMHDLLCRGGPIGIFPIGGHVAEGEATLLYDDNSASQEGRNKTVIHLPQSSHILLDDEDDTSLHVDNYHSLEPPAESGSINSFFPVRFPGDRLPILLIFRMVRNEMELGVDDASLQYIERLELPQGTRRCYVVVAPQGTPLRVKVPRVCFLGREKKTRNPDEIFPVFHYPVRLDWVF